MFEEIDEAKQKQCRTSRSLAEPATYKQVVILDSLKFAELHDRYDKITVAHEETFEWIFDDPGPGCMPWLRGGRQIYWIRGKPGSGKSTLIKLLVDDARTSAAFRSGTPLKQAVAAFFFHDRGTPLQKSLIGLLRGLLYQILVQYDDLVLKVLPMYSKSSAMGGSTLWSSERELQRALAAITVQQDVLGEVLIYIDGLDEYAGNHAAFLNWMMELIDPSVQQGLRIKLCISSRPLNLFEDILGGFPGLIIHEKTHQDIAAYVRSTVNAQITRRSGEQKREVELLAEEVVKKASGVFVWVKLVVDDLAQGLLDGDSMSQLRNRLAALPNDLEGLYARILHKLNPSYHKEARTIFEVVRSAQGFVTLLDLAMIAEPLDLAKDAVSKAIDDTEVQALCLNMERRLRSRIGGLIEAQVDEPADDGIDHLNNIQHYHSLGNSSVQILHQTAKDFLAKEESWTRVGSPQDEDFDPNETLLRICLQLYRRKMRHINPFMTFTSWSLVKALEYAKATENTKGRVQVEIIDQIDTVLKRNDEYRQIVPSYRSDQIRNIPLMDCAVSADLLLYISSKVSRGGLILKGSMGAQMLKANLSPYGKPAYEKISSNMTQLLLLHGADPNIENVTSIESVSPWQLLLIRVENGQNPFRLNKEAFDHWLALCHLYLDHGADPNALLPVGTFSLYDKDSNWRRLQNEDYTYPLHFMLAQARCISFPGFSDLVTHLLRLGASAKAKDGRGMSALQVAKVSFDGAQALITGHVSFRKKFRSKLSFGSTRSDKARISPSGSPDQSRPPTS